MISLVCSKCGTTLTVDDGFAGGVCRCIKCGTIQTVPGKGVQSTAMSGRSIYERADRSKGGNDLEALGDIVTSSGLVGSGMLGQTRRQAKTPAPSPSRRTPVLIGGSVAVLLAIIAALLLRSSDTPVEEAPAPAKTEAPVAVIGKTSQAPQPSGPRLGPVALETGGTVVYLLDRGAATQAYTGPLRQAVVRSIQTLGAKRKFQVRYWSAFGEMPVFPPTPAEATPANLTKLEAWFDEIAGGQATEAVESVVEALAAKPAELVIITGKAWQLDDSFVNEIAVKLPSAGAVKIHGISLGTPSSSDALKRVVSRTGGTYVELDQGALDQIAK